MQSKVLTKYKKLNYVRFLLAAIIRGQRAKYERNIADEDFVLIGFATAASVVRCSSPFIFNPIKPAVLERAISSYI